MYEISIPRKYQDNHYKTILDRTDGKNEFFLDFREAYDVLVEIMEYIANIAEETVEGKIIDLDDNIVTDTIRTIHAQPKEKLYNIKYLFNLLSAELSKADIALLENDEYIIRLKEDDNARDSIIRSETIKEIKENLNSIL